jgi:hypothetical protein
VKKELKTAWALKNMKESCNKEGLLKRSEAIIAQLDICKKSLPG